jgi:hypothetical protein
MSVQNHGGSPLDAARAFEFLCVEGVPRLLTTTEAGKCMGRSRGYAIALIEGGELEAHRDTARGTRPSARVTSRSVLLYLLKTAEYEPAKLADGIVALLRTLSDEGALDRIAAELAKRRAGK